MLSQALLALSLPFCPPSADAQDTAARLLAALRTSAARIEFVEPADPATKKVHLVRTWQGPFCTFEINHRGDAPVRIREVVLFELDHGLPATSAFYGEGFQMLSQTAGTLSEPQDLEAYTDRGHYRLPEPAGFRSVYGCAWFGPQDSRQVLVGFTSSRRFVGRLDVSPTRLRAVIEVEGLSIEPGSSWKLEELWVEAGAEREQLFAHFAAAIAKQHPRRAVDAPPRGWCSWYAFGPAVTRQNVRDNLEVLARDVPALRTMQIDDGYQAQMGDWLTASATFGGDVRAVLAEIKARGLVPALWVAPFIANGESQVFREHPEWFVQDADGQPLRSDTVGFGGWRLGPWYSLDGTHPEVQAHLEKLFRTLREDWGVGYFKLDANYWGAIHSGRFHDPLATRVEAYRRGMQAIRRGAGDAFLLGCNHPLWASLGLIDGSRSSMDVERDFKSFAAIARQNQLRRWQDGRLWWNDPDCLVLTGDLTEDQRRFHVASVLAAGGMLLSGDDLTKLDTAQKTLLARVAEIPGQAARRGDPNGGHVTIDLAPFAMHLFLNPTDQPMAAELDLPPSRLTSIRDWWTGTELAQLRGRYTLPPLAPRSARILELRPAPAASRERPKSASPSGSR